MRVNMHTHSVFCDGKDTPEEMVHTAIEKGFDILGFSGHGYTPADDCCMSPQATEDYICTINRLKEQYRNRITIYLGIEQDNTCRIPSRDPYDFVIGSVHFLEHDGEMHSVDNTREILIYMLENWYDGDFRKLSEDYYRNVREQASFEEVDIIGHLDLLTKFNEDESFISFSDPIYLKQAEECIHTIGTSKIFEANTGAIARGYRKTPYPHRTLLEILHSAGAKMMLNSDCHNRQYLDCGFEDTLKLLKDCGFDCLYVLKNGDFVPVEIDAFH
ncbi:MAG: histidinol-phosphatase [Solobacterium sp.]|nr:histidinol-phosphatase [Solobacterium sp.]